MTVAIVHYNTPRLTEACIRSLFKHTEAARVVVFDNSDREPLPPMPGVEIIDNTHGQIIDFDKMLAQYPYREAVGGRNRSNFGSAKHCASVDKLFDLLPDGFLLMDSDVLIHHDVSPLVDERYAAVGMIHTKSCIPLLMPMLCYINVPVCVAHGVRYFNGKKMWALSQRFPNNRYDTGAWFYESLCEHYLIVHQENIWNYCHHFGHGSWKDKNPEEWLQEYKDLWG